MESITRNIVVKGFPGVGKTSIIQQFVDFEFEDDYLPTIGGKFFTDFEMNDQNYDLKILDTAGEYNHAVVEPSYNMSIHGYILVYSITSRLSFETVKIIRENIVKNTGIDDIPIILVGNKCDEYNRVVFFEEGQLLASNWNATYVEASAKDNINIYDIFYDIVAKTNEKIVNKKENISIIC